MACVKPIFLLFALLNVTLTLGANGTAPLLNKQFEIKYFGKATWFNAYLSCFSCGGQLASIESQSEHDHVIGLIRDLGLQNASFWIAGTDLAKEGIFNWFTTGKTFSYSNFAQQQPDNKNNVEHCVEIRGEFQLKWNDYICDTLSYFICENRPKC